MEIDKIDLLVAISKGQLRLPHILWQWWMEVDTLVQCVVLKHIMEEILLITVLQIMVAKIKNRYFERKRAREREIRKSVLRDAKK